MVGMTRKIFFLFWNFCCCVIFAQTSEDLWKKLFLLEIELHDSEWSALSEESKKDFAQRLKETLSHPDMGVRARSARILGILGISDSSILDTLKISLNDSEILVRLETLEALRKLGVDEVLPLEIAHQALQEKRYILRVRALEILAEFASETSVETISVLLTERDWTLRRLSAIALGKIKSPQALPFLEKLLQKERSVPVLQEVIQAVGCIGHTQSVQALLPLLKHSSLFIREQTSQVLSQITGQSYGYRLEQFQERQHRFSQLSLEEQTRFLEELGKALDDGNWDIRFSAIEALTAIEYPSEFFLETLLEGLKHPARQVRYTSAGALGKLKSNASRAVPALIETASDSEDSVRVWSIWALGQIAPQQARSVLEKALNDPHSQVRRVAEEALKRIK